MTSSTDNHLHHQRAHFISDYGSLKSSENIR